MTNPQVIFIQIFVCFEIIDEKETKRIIGFATTEDNAKRITNWKPNSIKMYYKHKAITLDFGDKTNTYIMHEQFDYPIPTNIQLGDYDAGLQQSGLSKLTDNEKRAIQKLGWK